MHFKARAGQRLADVRLQNNLKKLSAKVRHRPRRSNHLTGRL